MMIPRTLSGKLKDCALTFPVVTLTGPRQSGKTTLVREIFDEYAYVSLEAPDIREFALEDPRGFLSQFKKPVILDEVQRAPELFSYIQVIVDERKQAGQFILTGSHNFLLLEHISQSLAGRSAVLHLLPFSMEEITGEKTLAPFDLGRTIPTSYQIPDFDLTELLFKGFYPRIQAQRVPPRDWLGSYYQTYLERDVRSIVNVGDLECFGRFVRLCAGRNGQLLNLTSLASDCGITHSSGRRWLSVLEASFIITILRPYHRNYGKRLIKSPRLFFLDTGLLCYLLQVRKQEELEFHGLKGAIFESYVLSEIYKHFVHRGERPPLSFWRDSSGHEVDILIENGDSLIPVEMKSSQTLSGDQFKGLHDWRKLTGKNDAPAALIYGGDQTYQRSGVVVYPWFHV